MQNWTVQSSTLMHFTSIVRNKCRSIFYTFVVLEKFKMRKSCLISSSIVDSSESLWLHTFGVTPGSYIQSLTYSVRQAQMPRGWSTDTHKTGCVSSVSELVELVSEMSYKKWDPGGSIVLSIVTDWSECSRRDPDWLFKSGIGTDWSESDRSNPDWSEMYWIDSDCSNVDMIEICSDIQVDWLDSDWSELALDWLDVEGQNSDWSESGW